MKTICFRKNGHFAVRALSGWLTDCRRRRSVAFLQISLANCGIVSRRTAGSSQDGLRHRLKTGCGIVSRRTTGSSQDGLRDPLKTDCGFLSIRTAGSSQHGLRDPLNTDSGILSTQTRGSSQHGRTLPRRVRQNVCDGLKTESIGSANAYV